MIEIKENELYQELELFADGKKIGEAEVEIKKQDAFKIKHIPTISR